MDVPDSTGDERFTSNKSFPVADSRPGTFVNTRTHILTEMQSFRHMDSEIDLTHSRQLDSDNSDMLIAVRPRLIRSSKASDLGIHSNSDASCNSAGRNILSDANDLESVAFRINHFRNTVVKVFSVLRGMLYFSHNFRGVSVTRLENHDIPISCTTKYTTVVFTLAVNQMIAIPNPHYLSCPHVRLSYLIMSNTHMSQHVMLTSI
ncbi:hypothetical protein P879_09413 [Paragonimus westermani]|uniref:Uncharacterized protein n=1 Tax=Paragonimus westermani TaxID=34504 RepID=A0A8T0DQN6_9TREM|nr:hypothetical protein P879_09413 [Paragonimus westermani]